MSDELHSIIDNIGKMQGWVLLEFLKVSKVSIRCRNILKGYKKPECLHTFKDEFLKVEQEDVIPLCTIYYESGQLNDDSWFSPNVKPGHATKQSPFSREGFSPNVKQEPQQVRISSLCRLRLTLVADTSSLAADTSSFDTVFD